MRHLWVNKAERRGAHRSADADNWNKTERTGTHRFGGGRATDPGWTERRLVPLAPRTLQRLEAITDSVRQHSGVNVEPMQLAALLLEKTTEQLSDDEAKALVGSPRRAAR